MSEIEKVLEIARRVFRDYDLQESSQLHEADGYDSMEHVQFLCELEEVFGVEITDTEILRNHTILEVVDVVKSKKGN